ncbi:MAG: CDP-2,3-bis-(O-geranylgeranyl)-sn-glycerol synthase [Patescibacteria group bacterium]
MWSVVWQAFYLAWPAYLANMAPVIFKNFGWLKFLDRPIDGGKKFGGDYLFGRHKTWRGLLAAIVGGALASFFQLILYRYQFFSSFSLFDYNQQWLLVGLLGGLGAILGDLAKSFFKRRLKIASGRSWPVFDQLDFIFGFFVFVYLTVRPPLLVVVVVFLITLILHPLTNVFAYLLRFKKVWW